MNDSSREYMNSQESALFDIVMKERNRVPTKIDVEDIIHVVDSIDWARMKPRDAFELLYTITGVVTKMNGGKDLAAIGVMKTAIHEIQRVMA